MDGVVTGPPRRAAANRPRATTGGVLAVVPARGGSKSIPRKNVRLLAGVPLMAFSIEAGLTATSVDRVVVSTDDPGMADVARAYGAEVPFLRPAALAEDTTTDLPVFEHVLAWLATHDGWVPDIVVHLRPTSPIRPPCLVDDAVARLRADPRTDSVRGVVAAGQNPYKMWRLHDDGTMTALLAAEIPECYNLPRQALPATYWQTGHLDVVRAATIVHGHSMSGRRILPLVIDSAFACDLDTEADWQRVEWMIAHMDRPFVRPAHQPVPRPLDGPRLVPR